MANAIVYEGVTRGGGEEQQEGENQQHQDDGGANQLLFTGYKLWFSRRVPSRDWIMQNAQSNGATLVPLEIQADVRLVDHARKVQPPGTHSYKWVEVSIRNGQLQSLEDHAVGSASRIERPVGSLVTAPKKGRTPFSAEDEQFLWNIMRPFVDSGGLWKGNEIYKQIEQMRPHHTYQSWRDRWIKKTQYQTGQVSQTVDVEPRRTSNHTPPVTAPEPVESQTSRVEVVIPRPVPAVQAATPLLPVKRPRHDENQSSNTPRANSPKRARVTPAASQALEADVSTSHSIPFTKERGSLDLRLPGNFSKTEAKRLYNTTQSILEVDSESRDESWVHVAKEFGGHSAQEWKTFWVKIILPEYCRRQGKTVQELAPEIADDERMASIFRKPVEDDHRAESSSAPKHSSPQKKNCSNCLTTETSKWRKDKTGNPLCNECGHLLKTIGVLRPSTAWTEVMDDPEESSIRENRTQQTTPPKTSAAVIGFAQPLPVLSPVAAPRRLDAAEQTPLIITLRDDEQHPAKSLTFEPLSPSIGRRVESNVARKRSTGRSSQSNSQESRTSHQSAISESAETALPQTSKTTRSRKEPAKSKRPRLRDEPFNLEIPSTPERDDPPIGQFSDLTPEEDNAATVVTSFSAGFKRREGTPARILPLLPNSNSERLSTPSLDAILLTSHPSSPLQIDVVSEPGQPKISSCLSQAEDDSDMSDTRSTMSEYAFETAADVSENWETAPETPRTGRDSAETQFLAGQYVDVTLDPFALPEPEGGWDLIDAPPSSIGNASDAHPALDEEEAEEGGVSSQVEDIDSWIASRSVLYPNVADLESILHMAIEATSFDYNIADQVVEKMVANLQLKKNTANPNPRGDGAAAGGGRIVRLPNDIPGCWTSEDDGLLRSQDARAIRDVERRHGQESCNRRFEFLEAWG